MWRSIHTSNLTRYPVLIFIHFTLQNIRFLVLHLEKNCNYCCCCEISYFKHQKMKGLILISLSNKLFRMFKVCLYRRRDSQSVAVAWMTEGQKCKRFSAFQMWFIQKQCIHALLLLQPTREHNIWVLLNKRRWSVGLKTFTIQLIVLSPIRKIMVVLNWK